MQYLNIKHVANWKHIAQKNQSVIDYNNKRGEIQD